ncbi:MAG: hypothetical protein NE334_15375 [Lentisphaeraceae bacterium]|nr:hypothetical protein [Lentisphaeraceae bacterium]
MKLTVLCILTLLISSCSKNFTDPQAFSLIPADFKVIAKVDIDKATKINGLGSRLLYERKRKPTLQILPIKDIQTLYLAAGSAKATAEKGGLYISQMKTNTDLEKLVKNFMVDFSKDKEVILGKSKFNDLIIHTIRDKKQEIAICQVGPKTCIGGPLKQVLASLKCGEKNIQNNKTLQKYMTSGKDADMAIYILSSEDGGSLFQGVNFFETGFITISGQNDATHISIQTDCLDEETAKKTTSALTVIRTLLLYSKAKYIKAQDIVISQKGKAAIAVANLSKEAMNDLFEKD